MFDEYKLYCDRRFKLGNYEGFSSQNKYYFLISVDDIEDQELQEMIQMGNHLKSHGDHEVATFIPTINNALTGFIDGQNCVLFQLPQYYSRNKKNKSIGSELANHHQIGKTYPQARKQYSLWTDFWINRLSQLDVCYGNIARKERKSSFDQAFLTSFPYYLGRTENAIQYIVDTNLDFGAYGGNEAKTISHYRFSPTTWMTLSKETFAQVKSPTDFVYDYPARDLSELIRSMNYSKNKKNTINNFIRDYEKIETISPKSWRYIVGRLLFPIEYFQIVEGYYRTVDDQEAFEYTGKLFDLFAYEQQMEQFLRKFHSEIIPTQWQQYIPEVDWLKNFNQTDRQTYDNIFKKV